MLHDIICMANNLENRDAYIIIGIDEEDDFNPVDVTNDLNRRNTQKLVDFLRDKNFAGGMRPIVYVETTKVKFIEIDVIVVKNTNNTPYYLIEKYQSVNANNIYTRIMDSNTPKNKSADVHHIEYLWRKRFRLTTSPLERLEYYIERSHEWVDSPSEPSISRKFYEQFPEFTIEYDIEDHGNAYQYYLFNQTDSAPHWSYIRIKYHQTLLCMFEASHLDGGRYFTPVPETDGIALNKYGKWDISFKYFIKESLRYKLHQFFYNNDGDDETISFRRFRECIIVFGTQKEKEQFKDFIKEEWNNKEKYSSDIFVPYIEEIKGYNMDAVKNEYFNVQVLIKMFDVFTGNV